MSSPKPSFGTKETKRKRETSRGEEKEVTMRMSGKTERKEEEWKHQNKRMRELDAENHGAGMAESLSCTTFKLG